MSTATPIKKPPRRPQRPMARLDSIKNPQPRPPPQAKKTLSLKCPNPDCDANDPADEDGKTVCLACGTVILESQMVSEVVYGLASGGQHVVHGFHVGADQTYAKRGDVVDKTRAVDSQELTAQYGHAHIIRIGTTLGMSAQIRDSAMQIFRLAIGGFIQGRRIKSVAAVALYIACRVQKEPNQYMLIDFSDILQLNVFNLGHVYQQFLKHLAINGNGYRVQPINPEDLILRFANRLEFHPETMQVAKDAVRIVQRMNRDWMTPGRRPAGVCGAALILAARMNNFRRSVREVVYVVKVQEQTICNRLEEFKDTESSGLTVEEFRAIDLERFADPPAYSQQKEGNKKRGRKRKHVEFGDDGDGIEPTVISSRATSTAPSATNHQLNSPTSPQHQAQIDSQTMPPPPLPIDPNLIEMSIQHQSNTESSPASEPPDKATGTVVTETPSSKSTSEPPPKRKRGCKPKIAAPPASQITDDQPFDARTLGSDLTAALTDPTNLDHANALHSALESASDPPAPPETQQEQSIKPRAPIPYTEDISDSEFADDPEVSNCLLTESEVAVKTRIWTHENRDYLRKQSAKILKQQLAEANGTARVIVRRRRRKKRMGDMRAYVGEDEEEGRPVAGSPADAVAKMMGRRAYSKKINYESILTAYAGSSASGSRRGSDAILAGSPGSGVDMPRPLEMSGALQVTSPGAPMRDTDPGKKGPEETEDGGSAVGGNAKPEEQQALDSIAGELEEGINESDDDDDEAVEEESVYGQGYDSD